MKISDYVKLNLSGSIKLRQGSTLYVDDISELRDEALVTFGKVELLGEFADRAGVKLPENKIKNRLS